MKNYARLTPEGTSDVLFDSVEAQNHIEAKLRAFFRSRGFQEVRTPGIEFYDVFGATDKYFSPESMYKLSDHQGRLIVIRPDSTIPIARLVATKLRGVREPLRLFYDQSVFRTGRSLDGLSHEMRQMGVELIGAKEVKSDLEILAMACRVFEEVALSDYRLELGHVGVFKALMTELGVDAALQDEVFTAVEEKNYSALNDLLVPYADRPAARLLTKLPRLFGGREVLAEARALLSDFSAQVTAVLDELAQNYEFLERMGLEDHIMIDFGLVNQADYYSGLVFRGYVGGAGSEVLSGGRYDHLMSDFGMEAAALGFAVRVDLLAELCLRDTPLQKAPLVLLYADLVDLPEALRYRWEDNRAIALSYADSLESAMEEAAARGAQLLLRYRNGTVETLEVGHA